MPDGNSIIAVVVKDGHRSRHSLATILTFFPSLSLVLSGHVAPPLLPLPDDDNHDDDKQRHIRFPPPSIHRRRMPTAAVICCYS